MDTNTLQRCIEHGGKSVVTVDTSTIQHVLTRLLFRLIGSCPIGHGCTLTRTATGRSFCAMCKEEQYVQDMRTISEERDVYKAEAEQLVNSRFLTAQLKHALSHSMVSQGWSLEDATAHVNNEFTEQHAAEILESQYEKSNGIV